MTNILTLTFEPFEGGDIVIKTFTTEQENSLVGYGRALAEVLPALREDGFVPFFYTLIDGQRRIESLEAWEKGNAMIDFQGFRHSWFMEAT